MSSKPIYITEFDLHRLQKLIQESQYTNYRKSNYLDTLKKELDRAKIVAPELIPSNIITMNSRVVLQDIETGEEETYTLVFPEDADIELNKVSVLAPIGTGMIGYEVGDVFDWPVPSGFRNLKVMKIIYQPEASGDFHL
ncbi:MAG: transcription elongation factor GreAB [Chloroflexi bacterium HGW-Chloroflexi-8]|jgi:regulator of nucleoside diphosphate kinase|nr:MAG: transcription elongation factor GreAB [Chloroflexi bacterium HGW-Chloroflexi-8]